MSATQPPSGKRLGIALGGGGSRAFVHLGVLKRLEEEGLTPALVSGSSMGAVLGALYARGGDSHKNIADILDYFRRSSLFGGLVRQSKGDGLHRRPGFFGVLAKKLATTSVAAVISMRKGLRRFHPVNAAIEEFFGKAGTAIEDLAIPFGLNALDLSAGREVEFTSGPLAPALKAGVAIGLVFAPYEWNGRQYADAAPLCPAPVGLARRMGADFVLAVDISAPLVRPLESHSGFDVVRRILSVQSELLNNAEIAKADAVLRIDASDVFWGDFSRIDELAQRGYERAGEAVALMKTIFDF